MVGIDENANNSALQILKAYGAEIDTLAYAIEVSYPVGASCRSAKGTIRRGQSPETCPG